MRDLEAAGTPPRTIWLIRTLLLEGVMVDVLHSVDQGVSCRLIASVFVEIMALRHWGTTQADQAAGLQVPSKNIDNDYSFQTLSTV